MGLASCEWVIKNVCMCLCLVAAAAAVVVNCGGVDTECRCCLRTRTITCGAGESLMAEELVPTLAKKPPTSIICGPGEEPRKLMDIANK